MKLFRKESLSKVTSLENLDKLLTVVGIKGWLILLFFAVLFVAIVLWAFLGKVPISVSGKAILLDPKHSYVLRSQTTGTVSEIQMIGGQMAKEGDIIVVLENAPLSRKIQERKKYALSLEQEIAAEMDNGLSNRYGPKKRELFLVREELADLEEKERGLVVRAPHNGKIIWVNLTEGDRVTLNEVLVTMQGPASLHSLKIFAFIPLGPGQLIKPGMQAKCSLDLFNPEKYGMILGKVKQVMPYPISPTEYYMQKIPSKPLKNYLMGNGLSNVLVVIDPTLDQKTYSGLAWTSGTGPQQHLETSSLGIARIILEEVKPISYVLPLFEK